MTTSTAEAELRRRMTELWVKLEDMRSGFLRSLGRTLKAFVGNSVAWDSIPKAVIQMLGYELRPESPFLCRFRRAKKVL